MPAVTDNAKQKSPEAIRQQKHREKLEALGVKVVEVELGPEEVALLNRARQVRGGLEGPYSVKEYLATLLRRDAELLQQEEGRLSGRICANCRKPLPRGCGGVWSGELECLRAQADRALQL